MENNNQEKAGVFALICSFLFPLIGFIVYFVNRKEVSNSSAYLYAAVGGMVFGMILKAIAKSMA